MSHPGDGTGLEAGVSLTELRQRVKSQRVSGGEAGGDP